MKTYIVAEINGNKAVLLSSDGEFIEVSKKESWKVGDTIQYKKKRIKTRYIVTVAACFLLIFTISITPGLSFILPADNSQTVASNTEKPSMPDVDFNIDEKSMDTADDDFDNIYDVVKSYVDPYEDDSSEENIAVESDAVIPAAPAESGNVPMLGKSELGLVPESEDSAGLSKEIEFSETNIQVEGVKEADVVITDGKYIYGINNKNLYIVEAKSGKPVVTSKIKQKKTAPYKYIEMYVNGNRLVAFREAGKFNDDEYEFENNHSTVVEIYDISVKKNPVLLKTFKQSGGYSDSRLIGNNLYLITSYDAYIHEKISKDDPSTFLPRFTMDKDVSYCAPKDVSVENENYYDELYYTVLSGIDISGNGEYVSKKSILGGESNVYCSKDNMYLYSYDYEGIEKSENDKLIYSDATRITKVKLKDGKINIKKNIIVPGSILNQFSLDEYKGVLRLVTTVTWESNYNGDNDYYGDSWEVGTYNALYTFDENLDKLGQIINIAPDEMIYSARFMGEVGYFVTFKQVDPLFTVDLNYPSKPRIIGELKIPGFSEYLHPYSDGRLLGIGNDADSRTGSTKDIKLTMFDNSDPSDVTEKHTHILKGYYYSEVADNHKSILVDEKRKIIAFPADDQYFIFTYDDKKGFKQEMSLSIPYNEEDDEYYDDYYEEYDFVYDYSNGMRGLFINNIFYVVTQSNIISFDMDKNFKKKGYLDFMN